MGAKIHFTPPTIKPLILIFWSMIIYSHRLDVNFILQLGLKKRREECRFKRQDPQTVGGCSFGKEQQFMS